MSELSAAVVQVGEWFKDVLIVLIGEKELSEVVERLKVAPFCGPCRFLKQEVD